MLLFTKYLWSGPSTYDVYTNRDFLKRNVSKLFQIRAYIKRYVGTRVVVTRRVHKAIALNGTT